MAGRRMPLSGFLALTVAAALTGCEHAEALKQGAQSSYHQELRRLAEDINRKELAKVLEPPNRDTAAAEPAPAGDDVQQAKHWHAPPLLSAIQLQPPVPLAPGQP